MKLFLGILGAACFFTLVGCTVLPSGPGAVIGDFMVTLSVNYYERTARVFQGDLVRLSLTLVNRGRPRTLLLTRRPAYDFVVTMPGGIEVWRWSYGKAIEDTYKEIETWAWGSTLKAHTTWDQRDLDGIPVPAGRYWVQGVLYTDIGALQSQRVELRIRRGSPLKLELEIPSQAPISLRGEGYWKLGQPIPLTLKLRNITERSVELTLLGRPAYDFIVTTDYRRREVWRWAQGQAIQEIAELRRLAPGEAIEFSGEWDQRDSVGQPIAPGRYCVQGMVHLDPEIKDQPVKCLSIGRGLPVDLELEVPERVKRGESVTLVWKIINKSACPVTVVDIGLDFMVTTPDGRVILSSIKRWWGFMPPIKPIESTVMTLQPGEMRKFEGGIWDQLDDEGYLVQAGVYLVRGFLWAKQETDALDVMQSAPQQLLIEP